MDDLTVQSAVVDYKDNSLVFLSTPTWEQAETTVNTLFKIHDTSGLWIGDAAIYLESVFPETYTQLFPDGELSKTAMNKRAICKKIPPSRRGTAKPGVIDVAAWFDTEEEQDEIISMGSSGATVAEVRDEAKAMRGQPPKPRRSHSVACPECNAVFIYEEGV